MSYNFTVKGPTKDEAIALAVAKFNEVTEEQPIHEKARPAVLANIQATVALLDEDKVKDIAVTCSGWIGPTESNTQTAKVECYVSHVAKE